MAPTAADAGTILLLGGRTQIGLAVACRLVTATPGPVVLAARRPDDLDGSEVELRAAGATAVAREDFDADDLAGHRPLLDGVVTAHGAIATAVVAFGVLGDQARAEVDAAHAVEVLHTDLVAQVHLLTELRAVLGDNGGGRIVVFSSIAGARVRRANHVYGAAKAGLDGFATGLSAACAGSGVEVVVVRPGFVIGHMTAGLRPAPLATTPEAVADATVEALRRGRRSVWVPAALGPMATASHLVPAWAWDRLRR